MKHLLSTDELDRARVTELLHLSEQVVAASPRATPQAPLDALTLRRHRELNGLRVAIVGDVRPSRVARSNVKSLNLLGAEVTLVAPPTLLPESLEGWPVRVSHDLDDVISEVDVVMLL